MTERNQTKEKRRREKGIRSKTVVALLAVLVVTSIAFVPIGTDGSSAATPRVLSATSPAESGPGDRTPDRGRTPGGAIASHANETEQGETNRSSVEFINCTAVEITGTTKVKLRWIGRYSYGMNFGKVTERVNGTTVLHLRPDSHVAPHSDTLVGESPRYVSFVKLGERYDDERVFVNPNREDCHRDVLPEKVEVFVVDATEPREGVYHVTYGYVNPNNYTITVTPPYPHERLSLFTSTYDSESERRKWNASGRHYDRTNRTPPTAFEPGRHTFTVEWRPDHEDARLGWRLDLSYFLNPAWKDMRAWSPPANRIGAAADANRSDGALDQSRVQGSHRPLARPDSIAIESGR